MVVRAINVTLSLSLSLSLPLSPPPPPPGSGASHTAVRRLESINTPPVGKELGCGWTVGCRGRGVGVYR